MGEGGGEGSISRVAARSRTPSLSPTLSLEYREEGGPPLVLAGVLAR